MDGAQALYRYFGSTQMSDWVSRRLFCVEASSREGVEREGMRILAIVGCDLPENGRCRKSKVSLAIYVSQGLVSTLAVS
jgi:hypothetical protein